MVDLSVVFNLPPEEAIAYLKSKGYEITWEWHEMWQEAHAQAFTVAKVMRLDILEDIRRVLEQAQAEGRTAKWFADELTPILKSKGWWGKEVYKDPDTGEEIETQLGSPRRLDTIFRVNMQTAYSAGRYQALMENIDDRPYWRYSAIIDRRTRKSHKAMHGLVFRYDDPFWDYFYPPNGWRCRCTVYGVSADDIEERGMTISSSKGRLSQTDAIVSAKTGETRPVAVYQSEKGSTVMTDVGWSYNPGKAQMQQDTSKYGGDLAKLAKSELFP